MGGVRLAERVGPSQVGIWWFSYGQPRSVRPLKINVMLLLDSLLASEQSGGTLSFSGEFCILNNYSRRHWSANLFMTQFGDEVETLLIFHDFKLQHLPKDELGDLLQILLQTALIF